MKEVQRRHKFEYSDAAKLFNKYVVLVTSLPKNITAEQVMESYRLRWQVEICFKRLKSILDFGELPKKTDGSTMAWLCGKLMVALLIESVMAKSFSPRSENTKLGYEKYLSRSEDSEFTN
jgi:transposase